MSEDDKYLSNPFWQRKMRTAFYLGKGSKGKIQREEAIEKIASVTGPVQAETLKAKGNEVMSGLEDPEDGLDYDTFVQNTLKAIRTNTLASRVEGFYGAMDYDNDGVVSPREYEKFLRCFKADTCQAKEAFSYIDTNKNGVLSKKEITEACVQFFVCLDEEHPSKYVFGPLVD